MSSRTARLARLIVVGVSLGALASPQAGAKGAPALPEDLVAEVATQLDASAVTPPDRRVLVETALARLAAVKGCLRHAFEAEQLQLRCDGRTLEVAWPPKSGRAVGNLLRSALTFTYGDAEVPWTTAEAIAAALADSLDDPFTAYVDRSEVAKLDTSVAQSIAAPGLQLRPRDPRVIHDVRPGSDAERQGLAAGDRILEVDGTKTEGLTFSDLTGRLIGDSRSVVRLLVQSDDGAPRKVYLKRDVVPDSQVSSEELPGGMLYIRVPQFSSGIAREVAEELWDHQSRGVVLDLRHNPGGRIKEGRALLELFFSEGPLGGYRPRPGRPSQDYDAHYDHHDVSLPVVVLVDGGSASAAEYVALVMKERGRATILGTTTLGKGSMQNSYPMPGGGSLKVTFARYVSSSAEPLPAGGLPPNRFLPRPRSTTVLDGGQARSDAWVLAALDILEGEGRYGGAASVSSYGPEL